MNTYNDKARDLLNQCGIYTDSVNLAQEDPVRVRLQGGDE